jgi:hypothetical protein
MGGVKRHHQNGSGGISAKRGKKVDKKKTTAHKRLLKLLRELPADIQKEWATANELRERLVHGGAHDGVTTADVSFVLGRLDKGVSFVCREFHENNTTYYCHLGFDHINVTPQNSQHPDYVLPPIEKDYFLLCEHGSDGAIS